MAFHGAPDPGATLASQILQRAVRLLRGRPERVVTTAFVDPADRRRPDTGLAGPTRRKSTGAPALLDTGWKQGRATRYADYAEMVDEVPEADSSLRVLVDFIFSGADKGSFVLDPSSGARREAVAAAEAAVDATSMQVELPRIVREGCMLGDSFAELIYADRALVGERSMIARDVHAYVDETTGRVVEWWEQRGSTWRMLLPFQVLHYAHSPTRGAVYGRAMLTSARHLRRRAESVQDVAVLLALKKMGGDERILWPFPAEMDDGEIWAWLAQISDAIESEAMYDRDGELHHRAPTRIDGTPGFMPYRVWDEKGTKPEIHQSTSPDIKNLVLLLENMQRRYFVGTGVPAALAGRDVDVNAKATLEVQAVAFMLTIRNRAREAAALVAEMINRALLVAGIVPQEGELTVYVPPPAQFDAELRAKTAEMQARAVVALVQAGAPLRFALVHVMELEEKTAAAVAAAASVIRRPAGGVTTEALFEAMDAEKVAPPCVCGDGPRAPVGATGR